MKFLSVCSGIEAASVAWRGIFDALAFCEYEAFPSAVLAHRYPETPNMGDLTKWRGWPHTLLRDADILVGGTPCQAFSIAGLRNSLADDRGNLSLEFVRLANAIDDVRNDAGKDPGIILWENVPGVLSVKDNAFGNFLAALAGDASPYIPPRRKWTNAGVVAGPARTVAWIVKDAQYFGVAQRRRRVFVVASAREGFDPAAILFECEGVRRDTPPRREKGKIAPTIPSRSTAGGGLGTDFDLDGGLLAGTLEASLGRSRGAGTPPGALPIQEVGKRTGISTDDPRAGIGIGTDGDPMYTLQAGAQHGVAYPINTQIALQHQALGERTGMGIGDKDDPAFTLQAGHSHAVAVAVSLRGREGGATAELGDEVQNCLRASQGGGDKPHVLTSMAVRRLTPVECSRLQGFPDDYLLSVTWRGKCPPPDGPMYKALGNSMAVPIMAWIGRRIAAEMARNTISTRAA